MKHLFIFILFIISSIIATSQVGVKIAPTLGNPDPSAMLEVESTNTARGTLLTRIDLTARSVAAPVTNPANSLLVYNRNFTGNNPDDVQPGYYYWNSDSTKWIRLISEPSSDDQNIDSLTLNGNILTVYIEDGSPANIDLTSLINDNDSLPTNELVNIFEMQGDSLVLSDSGSTFYVHKDSLGTDNQNISGSIYDSITDTLTIGIEDGVSEKISLSSLRDHDWYIINSVNQPKSINDSIYTYGNVGIGTNNPTYMLETAGANSDASINNVRIGRGNGDIVSNTVVGNNALNANTSGVNNIAMGLNALQANTTGIHNSAIGVSVLENNIDGRGNVGIGINSLQNNINGNFNVAFGETALQNNTTGNSNIAIGIRSVRNNINGSNNIGIGTDALANDTASSNIAIGHLAGFDATGSSNNIYIGNAIRGEFVGDNNIVIGTKNYAIAAPENPSALAANNSIFINNNAGAERIRIDNNGNTGIGAFDPTHKLDVNGEARIRTINDTNNVANVLTTRLDGEIQKIPFDTLKHRLVDHDWYVQNSTDQASSINDSIYTMGNVGIGVAIPGGTLDVINPNGRLLVTNGGNTFIERNTSNTLVIRNTDNVSTGNLGQIVLERGDGSGVDAAITTMGDLNNGVQLVGIGYGNQLGLVVDTAEQVGINNTAPTHQLDVNGEARIRTINDTNDVANVLTTRLDGEIQKIPFDTLKHRLVDHDWYVQNSTDQATSINDSIYTMGNVGIGVNVPTEKLHLRNDTGDTRILIESDPGNNPLGENWNPGIELSQDGNGVRSYFGYVHTATGSNIALDNPVVGLATLNPLLIINNTSSTTNGVPIQLGIKDTIAMTVADNRSVGIGTSTPVNKLQINGDVRVGIETPTGGAVSQGHGNRLYFSGGPSNTTFTSENSDQIWLSRYNSGIDSTELRVNIGDNTVGHDIFNIGKLNAAIWESTLAVVTSNERVGISTESPTHKLHVNNGGAFLPGSNKQGAILTEGHFGGGLILKDITPNGFASVFMSTTGPNENKIHLAVEDDVTGEFEKSHFTLNEYGEVGIGTADPTHKLHVQGNTYVQDTVFIREAIRLQPENNIATAPDIWMKDQGFIVSENNTFILSNGNNDGTGDIIMSSRSNVFPDANYDEHMRILTANGNVGIDMPSPEERLVVNGKGRFIGEATTDDPNASVHIEISNNAVGNNNNQIGGDRQFRILTETNLQSAGRDWLVFEGLDGNELDQDGGFIFRSRGNTGAKRDIMAVQSRLGRVGIGTLDPQHELDVRGTIGNNATLHHSDVRWKKNINPIENALEKILKVDGRIYEWRTTEFKDMQFPTGKHFGVIAQEIEKIFPELVRTSEDGYKSVDYGHLTPVLIEAIKEQQKQIDALKTQNNALKISNNGLSSELKKKGEVDQLLQEQINELKEILNQNVNK